jgi:hypothetical protein
MVQKFLNGVRKAYADFVRQKNSLQKILILSKNTNKNIINSHLPDDQQSSEDDDESPEDG